MPQREYTRFWCSKCQEFTLQNSKNECTICGTVNTSYRLSEVPEEKIIEQRKRYKESKISKTAHLYNKFLGIGTGFDGFFDEPGANTIIHETDAGQKEIDDARTERWEKLREERETLRNEYNSKFKGILRNDVCPCGSGKKYKKCCLTKFSIIF